MAEHHNNGASSPKAWLILLAIVAAITIVYPPILGVVGGLIVWLLPVAAIALLLGYGGRIIQ